jgi:hypothetical protein
VIVAATFRIRRIEDRRTNFENRQGCEETFYPIVAIKLTKGRMRLGSVMKDDAKRDALTGNHDAYSMSHRSA